MINPEILNITIEVEVMRLHSKGLSQFGISKKLNIPPGIAQGIIEKEIIKDSFLLHEE